MSKKINQETGATEYFIPIDGKYYETTEEVHTVYYKMDRRERYLQEQSEKNELSYDALEKASYPVEMKMRKRQKSIEDVYTADFMVEGLLLSLKELSDKDRWILEETFFKGRTVVELSKVTEIPRRTLQSRKESAVRRLKQVMVDKNYI